MSGVHLVPHGMSTKRPGKTRKWTNGWSLVPGEAGGEGKRQTERDRQREREAKSLAESTGGESKVSTCSVLPCLEFTVVCSTYVEPIRWGRSQSKPNGMFSRTRMQCVILLRHRSKGAPN